MTEEQWLDETEDTDFPLAENPLWDDVTPIPQDEGPNPAVLIMYSEEFKESMDYFRAILAANEQSERARRLTTRVIEGNAGNYTAWHFRRLCMKTLEYPFEAEFEFVTTKALDSPKNYQIWYHRRALVELSRDASRELVFTRAVISMDSKNYHAWAHRQWVIKEFNLWEGELEYVEELLATDMRNNSAWNQRWFVISSTNELSSNDLVVKQEVNYALSYIRKAPNNESPFNYLRGVARSGGHNLGEFPEVSTLLNSIRSESPSGDVKIAPVLWLLVDVLCDLASADHLDEAKGICDTLADQCDPIRKKYWLYRKQGIERIIATSQVGSSSKHAAEPPIAPQ